jgi:hypothetical protein
MCACTRVYWLQDVGCHTWPLNGGSVDSGCCCDTNQLVHCQTTLYCGVHHEESSWHCAVRTCTITVFLKQCVVKVPDCPVSQQHSISCASVHVCHKADDTHYELRMHAVQSTISAVIYCHTAHSRHLHAQALRNVIQQDISLNNSSCCATPAVANLALLPDSS